MLNKQINQYIDKLLEVKPESPLELYEEENSYIEKHQLLPQGNITVMDPLTRFQDVYLERCDKETEELLAVEEASFLDQPIQYFTSHINEFIYVESTWFNIISVDAISFEVDSVFRTYDVMLGLKVQKKYGNNINSFLSTNLNNGVFDLVFNQSDGLWDVNFSLNDMENFDEKWSIKEAFSHIYSLLFQLAETIESN